MSGPTQTICHRGCTGGRLSDHPAGIRCRRGVALSSDLVRRQGKIFWHPTTFRPAPAAFEMSWRGVRMACKPDSVPANRRRPFIWDRHCWRPRAAYPGGGAKTPGANACHPYSALPPAGLAMPPMLPSARWALTPPFHPYPASNGSGWRRSHNRRGGLFSVALSLGLLRPDVIRRRFFVKSGLSSPPLAKQSGRPAIRTET